MAKQLVQGYSMNLTAVLGHGPACLPTAFKADLRLGDSDTLHNLEASKDFPESIWGEGI